MTTLEKTADLLDVISARGQALRLTDLAEALSMPRSSVHRLCGQLVDIGYLRRDRFGLYTFGPRFLAWGGFALSAGGMREAIEAPMRALSYHTGESVNLHVARGRNRVCVIAIPGTFALVHALPAGTVRPLGQGAAGKIFLAHASPELSRTLAADPLTEDLSPEQLAEIRRTGWAQARDEIEVGLAAAAAPILAADGTLIAVLTCGGASARLEESRMPEFGEMVRAQAQEISERLRSVGLATPEGLESATALLP